MLESFLLATPYLFLKKIPYLWVPVVVFYTWPPIISGILLGIIALGLLMMKGQQWAWIRRTRREFARDAASAYVTRPSAPVSYRARNGLLLLIGSATLGWLLDGQLDFSAVQWALLAAGLMALYKDALLFGAGLTVILTDQGLSLRYVPGHVDYRILIRFNEIRAVRPAKFVRNNKLSVLSPVRTPQRGLLIAPRDRNGFSKTLGDIFLVVEDETEFMKRLPFGLAEQA